MNLALTSPSLILLTTLAATAEHSSHPALVCPTASARIGMSQTTTPEPHGHHQNELEYGQDWPLPIAPSSYDVPVPRLDFQDIFGDGDFDTVPYQLGTRQPGILQSNHSLPGMEPLSRMLATGMAGQPLPPQVSSNVSIADSTIHHPRLTMTTEQAFINMCRVTHSPDISPDQDPTIAEVEAAREDYVVRLMDAMHNLRGIHDKRTDNRAWRVFWFDQSSTYYVSSEVVESRCHVLFEIIMDRCRQGYRGHPKEDYAHYEKASNSRGGIRDARKATQDATADCKTRIEKVIQVLSLRKGACHEIVKDFSRMFPLANHPHALLGRKEMFGKNAKSKEETLNYLKAIKQQAEAKEPQLSPQPPPQLSRNTVTRPDPPKSILTQRLQSAIIGQANSSRTRSGHGGGRGRAGEARDAGARQSAFSCSEMDSLPAAEPPRGNLTLDSGGQSPMLQPSNSGSNRETYGLSGSHEDYSTPITPNQDKTGLIIFAGANIGTLNGTVNAFGAPFSPGAEFNPVFGPNHNARNVKSLQTGEVHAQSLNQSQATYPYDHHGRQFVSPYTLRPQAASTVHTYGQSQNRHSAHQGHETGSHTNESQHHQEPLWYTAHSDGNPHHGYRGYLSPTQFASPFKRPASQDFPRADGAPIRNPKKHRTEGIVTAAQAQNFGNSNGQEPLELYIPQPHKMWQNSKLNDTGLPEGLLQDRNAGKAMPQASNAWPVSKAAEMSANLRQDHNEADAEADDYEIESDEEDPEDYADYYDDGVANTYDHHGRESI